MKLSRILCFLVGIGIAITAYAYPFTFNSSGALFTTTSAVTPLTYQNGFQFDATGALVVTSNGGGGNGTVTSVAETVPGFLAISGSPITTSGTLAITGATAQTTHQVVGTGTTGTVGLLSLTTADLPTLTAGSNGLATSATTDTTNASNISSGTLAGARMSAVSLAASGNGGVTGTLSLANIATCAASQVLFAFSSTAAACNAAVTWTNSTSTFQLGTTAIPATIQAPNDNTASGTAAGLTISAGSETGSAGSGGAVTINAGNGSGTNANGGSIFLNAGTANGTGSTGQFNVTAGPDTIFMNGTGDLVWASPFSGGMAQITASQTTGSATNGATIGAQDDGLNQINLGLTSTAFSGSVFTNASAGHVSFLQISANVPYFQCIGALTKCWTLIDQNGNSVFKLGTNATSDTNGFQYLGKVAGVPTGVPASLTGAYANSIPFRYDSTDDRLYVYNGSWKNAANSAQAYSQLSYQPGLITTVVNTKSVYSKIAKASTVDNIEGSAQSLTTCTTNPTITFYECGTSASCASPTTIGTVTITTTGTAVDGTVSNAAIAAGDYVGWAISAGACASLDIGATAQIHTN